MAKAEIPRVFDGYPVVSPSQMAEIDRRATREYGIAAIELMENAGRAIAQSAADMLKKAGGDPISETLVTICCGRGNNGGDGLVAARYLKEMGVEVMLYIAPPKRDGSYSDEVRNNMARANETGVSVHQVSEEIVDLDVKLRSSHLLVDALLGTGASGKPAGYVKDMIQRMMKAQKPVLAVDIPSGLNAETGYHSGAIITAARTCTLGLPKRGLVAPAAQRYVGELQVLDIGFPKELVPRP